MSAVEQRAHAQLQLGGPGRGGRARHDAARGLEYIRRSRGHVPPPPIARLLDFSIVEVARGRVVFAMEPAEWMYNPIGSVHGGIAATILDSCMGCAVHTTLEAGVGYTTTDLQVRYIRAMSAAAGRVLAEGRVVHAAGAPPRPRGACSSSRRDGCSPTPAPAA